MNNPYEQTLKPEPILFPLLCRLQLWYQNSYAPIFVLVPYVVIIAMTVGTQINAATFIIGGLFLHAILRTIPLPDTNALARTFITADGPESIGPILVCLRLPMHPHYLPALSSHLIDLISELDELSFGEVMINYKSELFNILSAPKSGYTRNIYLQREILQAICHFGGPSELRRLHALGKRTVANAGYIVVKIRAAAKLMDARLNGLKETAQPEPPADSAVNQPVVEPLVDPNDPRHLQMVEEFSKMMNTEPISDRADNSALFKSIRAKLEFHQLLGQTWYPIVITLIASALIWRYLGFSLWILAPVHVIIGAVVYNFVVIIPKPALGRLVDQLVEVNDSNSLGLIIDCSQTDLSYHQSTMLHLRLSKILPFVNAEQFSDLTEAQRAIIRYYLTESWVKADGDGEFTCRIMMLLTKYGGEKDIESIERIANKSRSSKIHPVIIDCAKMAAAQLEARLVVQREQKKAYFAPPSDTDKHTS